MMQEQIDNFEKIINCWIGNDILATNEERRRHLEDFVAVIQKETIRPVKEFRDLQRPVIVAMRKNQWPSQQVKADKILEVRQGEENLDKYIEQFYPKATNPKTSQGNLLGLLLPLLFLLFSCKEKAQRVEQTSNTNIEVQFLFEHDGCKVYRFYDMRWIYYTDCRGQTDGTYKTRTKSGNTTTTRTHYSENQTVE